MNVYYTSIYLKDIAIVLVQRKDIGCMYYRSQYIAYGPTV